MSSYATGFNATPGPLLIDRAGHVLGGGEFGPVRPDEQPAKGHIAAGRLTLVEQPALPEDELDPGAVSAFAATAEANGDPAPAYVGDEGDETAQTEEA